MKEYLGKQGRDLVTGVEGIITAYTEHLNGCVRYCIQPRSESASKVAEKVEWVDAQELQIVGEGLHGNREWANTRSPEALPYGARPGGPAKADAPKGMGRGDGD